MERNGSKVFNQRAANGKNETFFLKSNAVEMFACKSPGCIRIKLLGQMWMH